MNGDDPELDHLLSPLRDGPVSLSSVEVDSARKARLMPAVRSAARAVPRQIARRRTLRRVRQSVAVTMAVASAAFLAVVTYRGEPLGFDVVGAARVQVESQGEQPLVWRADGAGERTIAGSDELSTTGELRAQDGARAALVTQAGAKVSVLPRSRLRVSVKRGRAGTDQLALLDGEVHCQVPPLPKGRSFVVTTPRTRVVVHGTEFRVRVGGKRGSCVSVREGLVEVQTEGGSVWLGPGTDWGCEREVAQAPVRGASAQSAEPVQTGAVPQAAASATTLVPTAASTAVLARATAPKELGKRASEAKRPTAKRQVRSRRRAREERAQLTARVEAVSAAPMVTAAPEVGPQALVDEGTLAQETRLLGQALRAEQQGNEARANTLFNRLITNYPSSPLVPEAEAGLDRLQ